MSFASPWALLLLIPLLAGVVWWIWRERRGTTRPEAVTSVPREEGTIMLAIDVSGSMAADDVSPYRLRAAQDAAKRFADTVPRQFQVGLVAFNGQADVLMPPSTETSTCLILPRPDQARPDTL